MIGLLNLTFTICSHLYWLHTLIDFTGKACYYISKFGFLKASRHNNVFIPLFNKMLWKADYISSTIYTAKQMYMSQADEMTSQVSEVYFSFTDNIRK